MFYITLIVIAVLGLLYGAMLADHTWTLANQENQKLAKEKQNLAKMLKEMVNHDRLRTAQLFEQLAELYGDQFKDCALSHRPKTWPPVKLAKYIAIAELTIWTMSNTLPLGKHSHKQWLDRLFLNCGDVSSMSETAQSFKTVLERYIGEREKMVSTLIIFATPKRKPFINNEEASKLFIEARAWVKILALVDGDLKNGLIESSYLKEQLRMTFRDL